MKFDPKTLKKASSAPRPIDQPRGLELGRPSSASFDLSTHKEPDVLPGARRVERLHSCVSCDSRPI